jgi:hypothetical protein
LTITALTDSLDAASVAACHYRCVKATHVALGRGRCLQNAAAWHNGDRNPKAVQQYDSQLAWRFS